MRSLARCNLVSIATTSREPLTQLLGCLRSGEPARPPHLPRLEVTFWPAAHWRRLQRLPIWLPALEVRISTPGLGLDLPER